MTAALRTVYNIETIENLSLREPISHDPQDFKVSSMARSCRVSRTGMVGAERRTP
jgi:hypothetical protein